MSISIQIGVDKTYVDDANQRQDVKIGDNKELLSKLRTDLSTAKTDIGNKVSTTTYEQRIQQLQTDINNRPTQEDMEHAISVGSQVTPEQLDTAIGNYMESHPVADGASIQDQIRTQVGAAQDSIVQEVGDMVRNVMTDTSDIIDAAGLVGYPSNPVEKSDNESFDALVEKLQEKPERRSDVLKKVINEDAYYWYVMPIIDQRIYRDTVVDINGQQVTVEYGWQKAVKERYWYHKGDSDIRDHYIYLFRTEINAIDMKSKPSRAFMVNPLPINGNNVARKDGGLPTGMFVIGSGRTTSTGRSVRTSSTTRNSGSTSRGGTRTLVDSLRPRSGRTIRPELQSGIVVEIPNGSKIDGIRTEMPALNKRSCLVTDVIWETRPLSYADPNYPSNYYYIGCYAECDDSAMYRNWMYTTNAVVTALLKGDSVTNLTLPDRPDAGEMYRLEKRDDGNWVAVITSGDTTSSVVVPANKRTMYYEYDTEGKKVPFAKLGVTLNQDDEGKLARRPFADVQRDIKVHMLPIYLLGSTGIAVDSDVADADGKFNYVTIDSMLCPASGEKRTLISGVNNAIELGEGNPAITDNKGQVYPCRDNVRMVDTKYPCVYGAGYTWLPLDAVGQADDEGGLGVSCSYTQPHMWAADGIYAKYNGLIPSGYTKSSLKSMATMYKYRIIEKFALGGWGTDATASMKSWTPLDEDTLIDGEAKEQTRVNGFLPVFVSDYSEDGIADLNEELYDINIEDGLISYTIKDRYLVGQETVSSGGVTISRYIRDTLAYLTENGATNTNNIFLLCVEDDGDEYIFDEYIWEKGKVLKLNEQKVIKYSEELRKVKYICTSIGHGDKVYDNTLLEAEDDNIMTEKILSYLTTEDTRPVVENGVELTIPNPNYKPETPESITVRSVVGIKRNSVSMEHVITDFNDTEKNLYSLIKHGTLPAIISGFKFLAFNSGGGILEDTNICNTINNLWRDTTYKEPDRIILIIRRMFGRDTFDGIDALIRAKYIGTDAKKIETSFIGTLTTDNTSIITNIQDTMGLMNKEGGVMNLVHYYSGYRHRESVGVEGDFTNISPGWWVFDVLMYYIIHDALHHDESTRHNLADLFGLFDKLTERITDTLSSYPSENLNYWTGFADLRGLYKMTAAHDTRKDPVGNPTLPVMEVVNVPIPTNGSDNLQRYNKVLSFLIQKNPTDANSGIYEWIYSCWRYMPTSKTYLNVGNRSFLGRNKPTESMLNNETADNSSNQSTREQFLDNIERLRQDIFARMDVFRSEDALINSMPRLKKFMEQCVVEDTDTETGDKVYKIAGLTPIDKINSLVGKINRTEQNMSIMVDAVNNGKRIGLTDGVASKLDTAIFQANISADAQPVLTKDTIETMAVAEEPNIVVKAAAATRNYTATTTAGAATLTKKRLL